MIIDFTMQTSAFFWTVGAVLALLAVLIFAGADPELAEVYLGEAPLFVAAVALAALMVTLVGQTEHFAVP